MNVISKEMQFHWHVVQPLFSIRNEDEYDKAVATLNGERDLTVTHIHALAARFQVNPAVFI